MPDPTPDAEPTGPPHGSVEEEAHKLVRAAAAWLGTAGSGAAQDAPGAGREPGHSSADGSTGDGSADNSTGEEGQGQRRSYAGGSHEEALCTGCPWCRAKAAAGPVGADTLDSLADLLASAAVSLRHFADSRRAGHEGDDAATPPQGDGS